MTNLKSILLGTGAAIVAATTAQAADLPIVEPVDYVQICDLYGDGFFYIPGTNTCLEISGFARFEARFNADDAPGDAFNGSPFALAFPTQGVVVNPINGLPVVLEGDTDRFSLGARGRLNFDARTETDLGTLRAFVQTDTGTGFGIADGDILFDLDLAFIQFEVGPTILTAGLAASISGVSGPDTLGDATAFESGLGNAVQAAFAFDFGPVSAAVAVSDPTSSTQQGLFNGFAGTTAGALAIPRVDATVGVRTDPVTGEQTAIVFPAQAAVPALPGTFAANPAGFTTFTNQDALGQELPSSRLRSTSVSAPSRSTPASRSVASRPASAASMARPASCWSVSSRRPATAPRSRVRSTSRPSR